MTPFDRRRLLAAGAALALGTAGAQPTSVATRTKGPPIWLDLDQADLDDAFDVVKASPNFLQVTRRWASNSDAVRARLGEPKRFSYGPAPIETLDVYTTQRPNAPVNVFIHGGAFNLGTARVYAFPAELFVRAGAHFVVPDFGRAQDFEGSPLPLLDQVQRAVAWVHRNARSFGGDPEQVYVSGHSSGAELAALLSMTDWPERFGLPAQTLKGGVCCSATYDFKALRLSAGGARLKISDAAEQAMSAERHLDHLAVPLVVAVGSADTAWFQRRTREFAAAAQRSGKSVQLVVAEGYNHFEIIETLASPYGALGRAVLQQMRLNA